MPHRFRSSCESALQWITNFGSGALAEDTVALFDPGTDDMMRDRDRRRDADALGMLTLEHQQDLIAREPARVLQLLAVDRDVRVRRARMAADHQRHRKRPGLRAEIFHLAADDAGLLQG